MGGGQTLPAMTALIVIPNPIGDPGGLRAGRRPQNGGLFVIEFTTTPAWFIVRPWRSCHAEPGRRRDPVSGAERPRQMPELGHPWHGGRIGAQQFQF